MAQPAHEARQRSAQHFSRRSILRATGIGFGAVGLAPWLLSGCSGQSDTATDTATDTTTDTGTDPSVQIVSLFSPSRVIVAGRSQRLPFGIVADAEGIVTDDIDVTTRVKYKGEIIDESVLSARIITHDHPAGDAEVPHEHADLARYFALYTTLPEVGIYDIEMDVGDQTATLAVQAFDEAEVKVLLPGEAFPPLVTATNTAPLDLEVVCTRLPKPCPFHDRTAAEILEAGQPMALLVATPAICFTAYCGPVLDTMLELQPQFPTVNMVHVEVYKNAESAGFDYTNPDIELTDAVVDMGLEFEPSLFLVDRSGAIVDRIDNVFDITELESALAAIA